MTISTEFQMYDLESVLGKYAAKVQKPCVFIRTTGWNDSSDVDKINESKAVYQDTVPSDMYTQMINGEWHIMELDELADIETFLTDTFPTSQAQVASTPEMYVFYALYNDQGQIIASNE